MEQKIRERAYKLWDDDQRNNKVELTADDYWKEAERQCMFRPYSIRSGELVVDGEGPLDEVIDGALFHAYNNNICLSESMTLVDCDGRNYVVETLPNLVRLGFTQ